jgi:hypothetical protein
MDRGAARLRLRRLNIPPYRGLALTAIANVTCYGMLKPILRKVT